MSQASYILVTKCDASSDRITLAYLVYILSLFFLFAQFYIASYKKPKKSKRA